MTHETIHLWRRLDTPGHDACRFRHDGLGWVIEGSAVFRHAGGIAALSYRLRCDDAWASRSTSVQGWIGAEPLAIEIARTEGADGVWGWTVDGQDRPELAGLADIDLGFTPATNANAIRRLGLSVGEAADSVAVWLDDTDWSVKPLPQSYRRVAVDGYDYTSPLHHFQARLVVDDSGAVVDYPGLWTREPPGA